MRAQTGADIGRVWLVALALFAGCVVVVRSMHTPDGASMRALAIGYVGILAIAIALFLSTRWAYLGGASATMWRFPLYAVLAVGYLALLAAVLFPFL